MGVGWYRLGTRAIRLSELGDDLNNPPSPVSEDEETPPTSPVIPDADGQPIPPIASFGQNFHFGKSSSTCKSFDGKILGCSDRSPWVPNSVVDLEEAEDMEKLMMKMIRY
ncbi:hypothetical protein Tco_0073945 [Tanacetum coccineum]